MRCLDKFNRKMQLSGGSARNENIRNSRLMLMETFENDASFRPEVYFWELGVSKKDYTDKVGIRIFDRKYSNANGIMAQFQTLIDSPVVVGDILYDAESDEYLICTESFNIDNIHWQGMFKFCNWILKWQNKQGRILEYPCYDSNTTQYNSGESANKQFTIGSSQHALILPCDENTVVLNNPQRFFLDKNLENPTSFMVTQNDNTSHNFGKKGLVKLTVMECAKNNETDRYDLGICDYIYEEDLKTDNDDNVLVFKSVISYDDLVVKSGGDKKRFVGKFFNEKGNEVDVQASWKIICSFSDALIVEEEYNELTISIDNDDYIDEEFKLVLSDNEGNYSSSIIIRVEGLF